MRRPRLDILFAAISSLLLVTAAQAAPDLSGTFPIGNSGTDQKPQSKLWFNDGAWWSVANDGTNGQHIWKFENGAFVKQTVVVDTRPTARADVLWDGTYLYTMMWHPQGPMFSQFSYDPSTQQYTRLPGFPVTLPILNSTTMVFDKDSTGRIYASYGQGADIHVIWTISADQLTWDTTGTILESGIYTGDKASTIAFGSNKIGVFFSNQALHHFGFRVHHDNAAPGVWDPLEIVDGGPNQVDDHINVKAAPDGRVFAAAKNNYNQIRLFVRATSGGWTTVASDINGAAATRPVLQIDTSAQMVHVFYTDWSTSPDRIRTASAPLSTFVFGPPEVYLTTGTSVPLNDVTGSKQTVSDQTGFLVMASATQTAYWGFTNLDTTPPAVQAVYPVAEQSGVALQPQVQVRLTDAGMGIRRSSIAATFDGAPIAPSFAGNAHEYLLSWTPASPLQSGQIYTLSVTAEDAAYPPHAVSQSLRFKTVLAPTAVARKINFQPQSGAPPAGYEADWGTVYTLESGKGWDKSGLTMKRAGVNSDPRLDTYVERKNSSAKATYGFDVANGMYRVTFVAGAPNAAGKQRVEVEGNVLINNQTTVSGQFITIADYAVAVQDGQLDVTIGGAGGSTKTQLCYLEFAYDGAAPPPPPPAGSDASPRAVAGLLVTRSGNDLALHWNAVTEDTTGTVIAVSRYDVYRGATPDFAPDRAQHKNRVGMVSGTTFTDLGACAAAGDHYYLVTAERLSGTESARGSNLGVERRIAIAPPPGGHLTTWVALPYNTPYAGAQDLVTAMNAGSSAGPVVRIARLDRSTQQSQVYTLAGGSWSGANFPLLPGEAYEVTLSATWNWILVGSETAALAYDFSYRTDAGNVSWISLPVDATYGDARALASALNGSAAAGSPVTKIARLNPATQQMESWMYFAGAWRGVNFPLQPAAGVAVIVSSTLPTWSPSRFHTY